MASIPLDGDLNIADLEIFGMAGERDRVLAIAWLHGRREALRHTSSEWVRVPWTVLPLAVAITAALFAVYSAQEQVDVTMEIFFASMITILFVGSWITTLRAATVARRAHRDLVVITIRLAAYQQICNRPAS